MHPPGRSIARCVCATGGLLLYFLPLILGLIPTLQQTYRSINSNLKDRTFIQYMCEKTRQKQIGLRVEKRESLNVGNGESLSISLISHSTGPEQYWDLRVPLHSHLD